MRVPSVTAGLLALAGGIAGLSCQYSYAQTTSGTALEEVIITSEKRSENLQTAPVAVTAVSAADILADHISDVRDLADSQPGLAFSESDPFDQQLAIRGIVTVHLGDPTDEPSIATFVDGVFIGGQGDFMTNFYDIDHIEITRGPQGVLLGKNVAAGALSVTNAAPEFHPDGALDASYGNYNSSNLNGHYTNAISDVLAGRFAFQLRNSDGWSKDILLNRRMNGYTSGQFRGELLYRPTDKLQGLFTLEYDQQYTPGLARTARQDPFSATPGGQSTYEAQAGLSDRQTVDPLEDYTRQKSVSATGRVDWDVVPGAKLTSISNVTIGTGNELFSQLQAPTPPLLLQSPVYISRTPHEYSEDLRLVSDPADERTPYDYIVGVYAYHNSESNKFQNYAIQGPALCAAFAGFLCGHSLYFEHERTDTDAVYGQAGYKITPDLRISFGARYLGDLKGGVRAAYCFETGQPLCSTPLGIPPGTGFQVPFAKSWYSTTPQAGASYQITPDSMAYFSWSKGFKGGGWDENPLNATTAPIGFNPEKATNYEIGSKNEFFDHRLRLNVALYYLDYTDLQVQEINQVCLCLITNNAASAKSKGVEVESALAVTDGVKLTFAGAYVDAHYTNFIDQGANDSGHQLQFSPRFKSTFGLNLTPDLGGQVGRSVTLRGDYTVQTRFYVDPSQTDYQNGFGLLNASITYHSPVQPWSVSLWGRNLTNQTYITYGQIFVGDIQETLAPPLMFGVSAHVDFQ